MKLVFARLEGQGLCMDIFKMNFSEDVESFLQLGDPGEQEDFFYETFDGVDPVFTSNGLIDGEYEIYIASDLDNIAFLNLDGELNGIPDFNLEEAKNIFSGKTNDLDLDCWDYKGGLVSYEPNSPESEVFAVKTEYTKGFITFSFVVSDAQAEKISNMSKEELKEAFELGYLDTEAIIDEQVIDRMRLKLDGKELIAEADLENLSCRNVDFVLTQNYSQLEDEEDYDRDSHEDYLFNNPEDEIDEVDSEEDLLKVVGGLEVESDDDLDEFDDEVDA